jgi:hypothetical protein
MQEVVGARAQAVTHELGLQPQSGILLSDILRRSLVA